MAAAAEWVEEGSKAPDFTLVADDGKKVKLSQFKGKPVVVSLVYYQCPMLCNQVLNGMLGSFRQTSFNIGEQFEVVTVSFDTKETPALAAAKKTTYVKGYNRPNAAAGWHFLTGPETSSKALADAVGFRYVYDSLTNQYAHGSAIIILSPEGKTTRYFYGFKYSGYIELKGEKIKQADGTEKVPTTTLKLSLIEAAGGKGGSVLDKLTLLCYRFDHLNKGYSVNVLSTSRRRDRIVVVFEERMPAEFMMAQRTPGPSSPRPIASAPGGFAGGAGAGFAPSGTGAGLAPPPAPAARPVGHPTSPWAIILIPRVDLSISVEQRLFR